MPEIATFYNRYSSHLSPSLVVKTEEQFRILNEPYLQQLEPWCYPSMNTLWSYLASFWDNTTHTVADSGFGFRGGQVERQKLKRRRGRQAPRVYGVKYGRGCSSPDLQHFCPVWHSRLSVVQSKALQFLQKRALSQNTGIIFLGGEWATNLIIANVKTLSHDSRRQPLSQLFFRLPWVGGMAPCSEPPPPLDPLLDGQTETDGHADDSRWYSYNINLLSWQAAKINAITTFNYD